MEIWELFLVAVSLSMDAFAVSVCKGLSVKKLRPRHCATAGLYFGGFQALMPLLGWLLGRQFESLIKSIDHWIAFGLLAFLGGKMIRESFSDEEEQQFNPKNLRTQLVLAVATSIDALAIGISFACTGYRAFAQIAYPLLIIGLVSFMFSFVGYRLGVRFGKSIARKLKPELLGGIILIVIGIKILLTHLLA